MSEHSRLSPSSMSRILRCPASAVDSPEDEGSAAAAEGTLAHSLCERILRGDEAAFKEIPNEEMRKAIFVYVAYVRAFRHHDELEGVKHENSILNIEERIVSEMIPDHGGTMDALIVSDSHIHVNDFKYGVMPVNARDNKQLLSYLVLADEKYPGRSRFFGSIIQPRVFGTPECVEYTRDQLDQHLLDVMLTAGDSTREAGDHCRWCPLKKTCDTLNDHLVQCAKDDFNDEWSSEKCKAVIEMAAVVSTLAADAKTHLRKLMKQGEKVEGWKLAMSLGTRCWKDEAEVMARCEDGDIAEAALYIKKLQSPAQVEKFSKAYKPIVAALAHRPERGIVAVLESSRLKEYKPAADFSTLDGS